MWAYNNVPIIKETLPLLSNQESFVVSITLDADSVVGNVVPVKKDADSVVGAAVVVVESFTPVETASVVGIVDPFTVVKY